MTQIRQSVLYSCVKKLEDFPVLSNLKSLFDVYRQETRSQRVRNAFATKGGDVYEADGLCSPCHYFGVLCGGLDV